MKPCILALDLGTQTGWALAGSDGLVDSGTVSFAPRAGERKGARFVRFRNWLNDLKAAHEEISEVCYERVHRHTGVDAAHVYGGLLATLMTWAEHHNLDYDGIGVQAIKIFATGNGNAKKDQMIEAMRARGFNPIDSNEADALALLLCVMASQPPIGANQKEHIK